MFDYIMFVLPLAPMVAASVQDFRSKKGEFRQEWIYMSVLLAGFWKILIYPDTLISSFAFTCLTGAIASFFSLTGSWADGDAIFFTTLGFILPPVDVTFFLVSAAMVLALSMAFDRLVLERWGRGKFKWTKGGSHSLWVICMVYIGYWLQVVL